MKKILQKPHKKNVRLQNAIKSNPAKVDPKKIEARSRAVFDGLPIPSYIWQHVKDDFILIDHNNAAVVITQGLIARYLGSGFSQMYKNSPYKRTIEYDFLKCISEKTTVKRVMSYKFICTDIIKDLKVWYVFVPPDLILVHTEDITGNKIVEEELMKLSRAVEQTSDSVVITNKEGIIEYVNKGFVETTGYSRDEVLGKTPRILQSGKHDKEFYRNLWETILCGNTYMGTIINKKKNDELYWSQQSISPMKNKNGEITNFVSVLKDITELMEKKEQEIRLKIACELQEKLYKSKISVPGFDIAGKTYSAVRMCGDYFDFILMKDGSIGIVIGDVCGHGIDAALIMVETLAYTRALAKFEIDPGVILNNLNQELADNLDEMHFVTLILARLDPGQNLLEYASAGHIPAYLLKNSDEKYELLESTGIPLGVLKDYIYYTSKPVKLAAGDILAFITDGIVEAKSIDETEFGHHRTLDVIRSYRQSNAEQIIEQIYRATRSFVRNQAQEDDITSIICKVDF